MARESTLTVCGQAEKRCQRWSDRRELARPTRELVTSSPGRIDELRALAKARGIELPQDYIEFMASSDGSGDVGDGYIELWPVRKILFAADAPPPYEDFLAFAGDGANTVYGFDLRVSGEIVEGDRIGFARDEVIHHGRTLTALLRSISGT